MKIGIDIRSTLKPQRTGIGQYTFNLIETLAKTDHRSQYLLYSRIKPFSRRRNPKVAARNFRFFTERFGHKPEVFFGKIDLYHSSSYDLIPPRNKKFVLTIHDVIVKAFPQGHPSETVDEVIKALAQVLERVSGLIVVSENTKKDVVKWFKFPEHKIKVIHLGAGREFHPLDDREKLEGAKVLNSLGIEGRFILFVGTIEPRKNLDNLIRAFGFLKDKQKIEHKLVIAGMKSWNSEKIFELVNNSGLAKEVIFTGYLRQEKINMFYNLADCFIYPSLYEGFGLPIVEAFHTGCAVITSNRSSCAEVAGNAAILVNPESVDEIADSIFRVVSDNRLNSELSRKALNRAKDFSWDVAAHKTLNFFHDVYHSSR